MSDEISTHGYLLDTHTAIWALDTPEKLTASARNAVLAGPNVLSVVSYWEVMLKSTKGTLDVGDPRMWWSEALEQLAATPLVLRPQHIAELYALPPIHKDPFDRMLIAQAAVEGLALVSSDSEIMRYASKGLRVVGGG
ncbi:MAG: type II toxin-antitoxin system VapC family toxin [Terracidiphilus sp.]